MNCLCGHESRLRLKRINKVPIRKRRVREENKERNLKRERVARKTVNNSKFSRTINKVPSQTNVGRAMEPSESPIIC